MFFGGGFPFGDFGGEMHMEDDESDSNKKPVDTQRFYDILGVPKTATEAEVKKAFRKKALKDHPDKGGDPEKVLYNKYIKQIYIVQRCDSSV